MAGRLVILALSLAVTLLLLGPLTGLLAKAPAFAPLAEKLSEKILQPLEQAASSIGTAVDSLKLPAILEELLRGKLPQNGASVAEAHSELSTMLFRFALNAVVFIVLFALFTLLIHLVARSLTRMSDAVPVLGTVNRIGGLTVGLAIGIVEVAILLLLVGLVAPYWPALAGLVAGSRIAGYFYSINILYYLMKIF
jgi:hypothetical protein